MRMSHLFMDILKACAYFKNNNLPENVMLADDITLDLDTIGNMFGIKIHLFDESHHVSQTDGPELFLRFKNDKLIFHSNPGKITNLPSGLNKQKGAKFKTKDIVGRGNHACLFFKDIKAIEAKYNVSLEVWEKKNLGLNKPCVKKIKTGKIPVHRDTFTDILFLITDHKTYFRCNLNKCKK